MDQKEWVIFNDKLIKVKDVMIDPLSLSMRMD